MLQKTINLTQLQLKFEHLNLVLIRGDEISSKISEVLCVGALLTGALLSVHGVRLNGIRSFEMNFERNPVFQFAETELSFNSLLKHT